MDFYPRDIMLTCLYVACKAADFPIGLQTFISHIPRNQERYSYLVLNSELFLMESLGYDLWVYTPYQALTGFVIDLVAYQVGNFYYFIYLIALMSYQVISYGYRVVSILIQ